jgi:hypothetical protein
MPSPSDTVPSASRQQNNALGGLVSAMGSKRAPQLLISDEKRSAQNMHLPVWALVGRDLYLDVSSVLLTSNDEAVALLACTMSMAGSILKSAADQIGPLELIAP